MSLGKLRNVAKIDLPMIPENSIGVILSYEVEPRTGSVLIYRAPGDPTPTELPGPKGIALVPILTREFYVQRVKGTTDIKCLVVEGYSDDPADFASAEMRQALLDRVRERGGRWPLA